MTFARVQKSSGLTKIELGIVYGVSRQTIHTWSTGGTPREGSYTERMASVITTALCAAIDKRVLPMAEMDKPRRRERVRRMSIALQSLKPAAK